MFNAWVLVVLPQVIAGCLDGSCVLVDVSAGCQLARWKAHSAAVHSINWTDIPHSSTALQQQLLEHNTPAQPDGQQQQHHHQQQQQGPDQGPTDQPGTTSSSSGSAGGGEAVAQGAAEPQFMGLLVSAGADRRVKLWRVPRLATQPHLLPQTPTQAAAAAAAATEATAAAESAAAAVAVAVAEGSEAPVHSSLTPAAAKPSDPDITTAAAGAAAATASGAADSNMQPGQGITPGSTKSRTAAAATATTVQRPAVLQLQPVSAAAVDPSPPTIGPKSQQFYGTAALVPGSAGADGSCVVVCAGVNGRVGVVNLLPGGWWRVLTHCLHLLLLGVWFVGLSAAPKCCTCATTDMQTFCIMYAFASWNDTGHRVVWMCLCTVSPAKIVLSSGVVASCTGACW